MQSLFKSLIDTVTSGGAAAGGAAGQSPGTVAATSDHPTAALSEDVISPNPLHLADGPDYVSIPANSNSDEELSFSGTLANLSSNLSSIASSDGLQQLQTRLEQLKQNPQIVSFKTRLSQFQETALEVARDMNKELSQRLSQGDFTFNPDSPEYRNHPLRYLPWERPGEQWGELVGEELYTEEQIERAIKDVICSVTKDAEFLSMPPPPHYVFVMDKPRQRYAFEILKFDKHLEHLRYQLVPKKFQEEDFWLIYFWKLEQLLATFPAGFTERLESVKFEDSQAGFQAANRDRALQELINEQERASLGTIPVSVIPDFLNPTRIQEFFQSTTSAVFNANTQHTQHAQHTQHTQQLPPPPPPIPTATSGSLMMTNEKSPLAVEPTNPPQVEIKKSQDLAPTNILALDDDDDDDESPDALLDDEVDGITQTHSPLEISDNTKNHHQWVSPLEEVAPVDEDDLEEFEKQLLGET